MPNWRRCRKKCTGQRPRQRMPSGCSTSRWTCRGRQIRASCNLFPMSHMSYSIFLTHVEQNVVMTVSAEESQSTRIWTNTPQLSGTHAYAFHLFTCIASNSHTYAYCLQVSLHQILPAGVHKPLRQKELLQNLGEGQGCA